jgi:hypothetical protein
LRFLFDKKSLYGNILKEVSSMEKRKTYLNNYMFSIIESSPVFINQELYEQVSGKSFIDSFHGPIFYSFGYTDIVVNHPLTIVPLRDLDAEEIILKNNKLTLGTKNHNFELFEIAVDAKQPIIYDWVIGSTKDKKKYGDRFYKKLETIIDKELVISCLCFINGEFKYVQ